MSATLSVLWTVSLRLAPHPWRHCSRCGEARPFASSGRFRVNANGRRLDAWLIYRCADCGRVWNRPVLERRPLDRLAPDFRAALEANDAELAERIACDLADLGRHAHRIERGEGISIARSTVSLAPSPPVRLDLRLVAAGAVRIRLDRILAEGLGLPRARIRRLHEAGHLCFPSTGSRPLSRALPGQLEIALLLADLPDGHAIAGAAAGAAYAPLTAPTAPPSARRSTAPSPSRCRGSHAR